MPKIILENTGRRRLTPKGSRAPSELELDIPNLKPGEGRLLPTGEVALHDANVGVIVLRADNAYAYIPKVESANPLDKLVSGSSKDDDAEPAKKADDVETEGDDVVTEGDDVETEGDPLIGGDNDDDGRRLGPDAMGTVTDGSGIGTSY